MERFTVRILRRQTSDQNVPFRSFVTLPEAAAERSRRLQMLWIGIGTTLVTGAVVMAVLLAKRPVDVDELGSVSDHWLAQHRVDAP